MARHRVFARVDQHHLDARRPQAGGDLGPVVGRRLQHVITRSGRHRAMRQRRTRTSVRKSGLYVCIAVQQCPALRHHHRRASAIEPARESSQGRRCVGVQRPRRRQPHPHGVQTRILPRRRRHQVAQSRAEPVRHDIADLVDAAVQLHAGPTVVFGGEPARGQLIAKIIVVRLFTAVLQKHRAAHQWVRQIAHHRASIDRLGLCARHATTLSVHQRHEAR